MFSQEDHREAAAPSDARFVGSEITHLGAINDHADGSVIEQRLRMMTRLLDCGALSEVDAWLTLTADRFARGASDSQRQCRADLEKALVEARTREAAQGGPGSLYNPNHEFAVAMKAAINAARGDFPF